MTYKAAISIASNSPGTPTGYGVQSMLLAERLKAAGYDIAALSNYGLEGSITTLETSAGKIAHYPKGLTPYSGDALALWHSHFIAGRDIPNALLTLYDAWVYEGAQDIDSLPIWSWTPVDHVAIPTRVLKWAKRPNVKTIAMSPFGQRLFEKAGIKSTYIPHAVDTKVYKPTDTIAGYKAREFMGVDDDAFLVGFVGANKANASIHRKAIAENLLAFSLYYKENPKAVLYIHSEPSRAYGGFDIPNLLKAVGLPPEAVVFADPTTLRTGYPADQMAGIYSALDVLLHASYGEGFGVPAIEAQACGTRVIGGNWTATPDLLGEDSWLVDGQPFWDEAQTAFFMIPLVPSIVGALQQAAEARGDSEPSVQFAKQFDADLVFKKYWKPFLKENL